MSTKTARLDLRLTEDQRELLERAATTAGSSLTSYTIGVLMDSAAASVARARTLSLSEEDWEEFTRALEAPDDHDEAWQQLRALQPVWAS
ncbi:MAG: DUF1778 domain-containing protein [Propionibacteriaceae bacterium]|nr:DUF1778 domain-containing protein [Propionibacteriaceae bacterium]